MINLYFVERAVARKHRVHFCDRRCIYGVSLIAQYYAEVHRKCNESILYMKSFGGSDFTSR